jgi:hypothetical protein
MNCCIPIPHRKGDTSCEKQSLVRRLPPYWQRHQLEPRLLKVVPVVAVPAVEPVVVLALERVVRALEPVVLALEREALERAALELEVPAQAGVVAVSRTPSAAAKGPQANPACGMKPFPRRREHSPRDKATDTRRSVPSLVALNNPARYTRTGLFFLAVAITR